MPCGKDLIHPSFGTGGVTVVLSSPELKTVLPFDAVPDVYFGTRKCLSVCRFMSSSLEVVAPSLPAGMEKQVHVCVLHNGLAVKTFFFTYAPWW